MSKIWEKEEVSSIEQVYNGKMGITEIVNGRTEVLKLKQEVKSAQKDVQKTRDEIENDSLICWGVSPGLQSMRYHIAPGDWEWNMDENLLIADKKG